MYSNMKASSGKDLHTFLKQMGKNVCSKLRLCFRRIIRIVIVLMQPLSPETKESEL